MKIFVTLALSLFLFCTAIHVFSAEADKSDAEKLHCLGLISGVGNNQDGSIDFDTEGNLTRAQAITQIVRFLGMEKTAISTDYVLPFTDLPTWAVPYVGYAYTTGITKGVSATKFGSDDRVSEATFLTLVLRTLGYDDTKGDFLWNNPYTLAKTVGILDNENVDNDFTRGDAFTICYKALTATVKSGDYIKDQLIAKGVFTTETYDKVAGNTAAPIIPTNPVTKLYSIKELNRNVTVGSHASDDIATAMLEINYRESLSLTSATTGQTRYDNAFYPRIKKIRDNLYVMFWMWGELGPHLLWSTSKDGVNWEPPQLFYRNEEHPLTYVGGSLDGVADRYCAVNADLSVLDDGDVLCTYYVRPNKGYIEYPALNMLMLVRGEVTEQGDILWGEHKAIYHGQGWEPFIWQRDDSIIEIYWSSPVAYIGKYGYDENIRSAGVMMIQSKDNGYTWTPNIQPGDANYYQANRIFNQYIGDRVPNVKDKNYTEAVPYFGGQMPAVTRLYNGKTLLACEVRKLDLGFTLATDISLDGGEWNSLGMLDATPDSDWKENLSGAGPYLASFPSGEIYISYHSNNRFYGRMISPDGDTVDSHQFVTVPEGSGMWGASELVSSHEVITVAQQKDFITGISGIAITHAYLNHRINAAKLSVSTDGYTNEWEENTDAFFVGSETQAQIAVQVAHDNNNVHFLISRLDEYLTDGDIVTLSIGISKTSYYRIKIDLSGNVKIEHVDGGTVKDTFTGGTAVIKLFGTLNQNSDKDTGALTEFSLPKELIGISEAPSFKLSLALDNKDGLGITSDGISGISPFNTDRWPAVIFD